MGIVTEMGTRGYSGISRDISAWVCPATLCRCGSRFPSDKGLVGGNLVTELSLDQSRIIGRPSLAEGFEGLSV